MNNKMVYMGAFVHAIIALVIIAAATVLAALHDLDGQTVAALFGTAVGILGGSASSLGTLYTAVNGKSVISAGDLDSRETTLREAMANISASPAKPVPLQTPAAPPVPAEGL